MPGKKTKISAAGSGAFPNTKWMLHVAPPRFSVTPNNQTNPVTVLGQKLPDVPGLSQLFNLVVNVHNNINGQSVVAPPAVDSASTGVPPVDAQSRAQSRNESPTSTPRAPVDDTAEIRQRTAERLARMGRRMDEELRGMRTFRSTGTNATRARRKQKSERASVLREERQAGAVPRNMRRTREDNLDRLFNDLEKQRTLSRRRGARSP